MLKPSMAQLIANLATIQNLIEEQKVIPLELLDSIKEAKQLAIAIELLDLSSHIEQFHLNYLKTSHYKYRASQPVYQN